MTDKLQEITEKIYYEGVEKAKINAQQIIEEAKAEATRIVKSAKEEAKNLVEQGKAEAEEVRKNTESEMKLAARQFLSQLKQKVTELITTIQTSEPVKEAFSDKDFIKKIILTIVENWKTNTAGDMDLKILLPEKDQNEFTSFLQIRAVEAMNRGLEIQIDPKMKDGFKIGPKDNSYIIHFSDTDFDNYFKSYLKDKTQKLLFNE